MADPNGYRGDDGPVLVGYRFSADGGRERLLGDPAGSYSEVLHLELVVENGVFLFRDPGRGEIVPDYHEVTVMRDDAEARARTAEARVAELEQQIDELAREP